MDGEVLNQVREHRLLHGDMTQEDLATRIGVSRQTVVAIEKGNYNPSVGLALRIARVFGVAVEAVFTLPGGKGEATRNRKR